MKKRKVFIAVALVVSVLGASSIAAAGGFIPLHGVKLIESLDSNVPDVVNTNAQVLDNHIGQVADANNFGHVKLANDLKTTDPAFALSAAMGAQLNSGISDVSGTVNNNSKNLNDHMGQVADANTLGHVKLANDLQTSDLSSALSAAMGAQLNSSILDVSSTVNNNSKILDDHMGQVADANTLGHIKIGKGLQMTGDKKDTASVKIANDLKTNDSDTALSAAMGKQLSDDLGNVKFVHYSLTMNNLKANTWNSICYFGDANMPSYSRCHIVSYNISRGTDNLLSLNSEILGFRITNAGYLDILLGSTASAYNGKFIDVLIAYY